MPAMSLPYRTVDPYRDTHVIDARGPRTNQAIVGVLSLAAFLLQWDWLVALVALQQIGRAHV